MFEFAVRRELITIRDHPFYGRYQGLFRKWPLLCRDCGDDFLPDGLRIVRCPSCRANRRRHEQQRQVVSLTLCPRPR